MNLDRSMVKFLMPSSHLSGQEFQRYKFKILTKSCLTGRINYNFHNKRTCDKHLSDILLYKLLYKNKIYECFNFMEMKEQTTKYRLKITITKNSIMELIKSSHVSKLQIAPNNVELPKAVLFSEINSYKLKETIRRLHLNKNSQTKRDSSKSRAQLGKGPRRKCGISNKSRKSEIQIG